MQSNARRIDRIWAGVDRSVAGQPPGAVGGVEAGGVDDGGYVAVGLLRELGVDVPPGAPDGETDVTYANTSCPYCAVALDPPPKSKKRRPACGQSVYVRKGPDDLRYLLQAVDLPAMDQAWDEYRGR